MRARYVLSEVMVGLWRNVTMTIAMIITMAVSLTMLGASLVMYHQIDLMKQKFESQLSISVYLTAGTPDDQATQLKAQIAQDPLVIGSSVSYITQKEAFAEFQKQDAKSYPNLVGASGPQDLPASIRLKLKDQKQFPQFSAEFTGHAGIEDIQNQASLLNKVFKVLGALQGLALVLAVAQGLAALLLVANTIQVAAYSKRREVAVMKLVGASNWFIQAPFVLEAMFAGIIGAILAWVALVCAKIFLLDGSLNSLTALLGPVAWGTINVMLPLLVVSGALVSGITGWITLRFYIKK
jgi:cell division transport system permease protein